MAKSSAIVLSSGGLHSLVVAGLASREYRIAMLHIKDGRVTASRALEAFEKQVGHFKPFKTWIVDGTYLRQMALPPEVAGSVRTTSSDPQGNLIPQRELQLLSMAAGFARQIRADTIIWGVQHDSSAPDAIARNIEVAQLMNQLLEVLSPDSQITVKTPLEGLEDKQVIELAYQMSIPFASSWTCQMDLPSPCMSCPACSWRTRAFRAAQLADPLLAKK